MLLLHLVLERAVPEIRVGPIPSGVVKPLLKTATWLRVVANVGVGHRRPVAPSWFRRRIAEIESSALAGLVARIGLVDDVDAAATAHDAAVLVAVLQRLQRIH